MIHVNVRGSVIRNCEEKTELLVQLRKRQGEPEKFSEIDLPALLLFLRDLERGDL